MKKKDIIQLVKETVKENTFFGNREQPSQLSTGTKVSVPTDEYPFSKKPKRTATGMMEAGPSNNPYYNNLVKKAKEMGIHVNDLMKSLLKDKSEMEIVKMGYQDVAALAGVEDLKEFTSMGQEGIYPRKEEPGDMFQQKEVEELLPNGMASRDDREFQARLKQHADWTEESGYNNTFVHIQYHDSFNREHSYRIHQSQNYNGNYKDFRNPKFTVLTITKKKEGKEEELGKYIVDTDAYLKDFANLRNDDVLGKQVSENKEIDEIKVNYDFSEKELVRIVKQLKRGASTEVDMIKAFEKALGREITDKELFKEAPMFKTDVKQDMAPEGMAGRIKSVFNKVNGAKDPVQTPEWHKNRFKSKYGISFPEELKGINKDQALAMNKYANDMKITEAIVVSKMTSKGDAADLAKSAKTTVDAVNTAIDSAKLTGDEVTVAEEEDLTYEPEDMDNPDEDLVIIGSGYLDIKNKFKGRPNMTNGELATIGQKVVDKLHNGDKDAAIDYIMSKINEGEFTNDMGKDKFVDDEGRHAKMQLQKAAEYSIKLAKMMDDMTQLPSWVQSKITKASDYMSAVYHYLDYEMTSSQDNLMENVDKYKKRSILMEGAMKKFFEMFDQGKTDEEIVQDYAQKGTTVPEPFVNKARRQYEGMKKLKLELEMSEKEFRNSSEKMVNNAEEGMEYEGEEKTLASGLTNEQPNEGNAFGLAMQKAKEAGDDSFELDGETFKVEK